MTKLPTFLGIGSARCASTWLHQVLSGHPEIRLTRDTEVDYFSKHILREGLDWYLAQFAGTSGASDRPVRGDISPSYCRLSRPCVEGIRRLIPDGRVVFTIRNPVERQWSHAVLHMGWWKRRSVARVPLVAFLEYFERTRTCRFSDYERTIDIWSTQFGTDAMLVALYDRLTSDPSGYLAEILSHVGADPGWSPPREELQRRVWSRRQLIGADGGAGMPDVVRWYLARQWRESVHRLNGRLEGRLDHWVREIDEAAAGPRLTWRVLRRINRSIIALPERMTYPLYDAVSSHLIARRCRRLARAALT